MTQDRQNQRILDIVQTHDSGNNDITDVTSVTFYRSAQSKTAGNGFLVDVQLAAGEGGTKQAPGGADLASNDVWIFLSEQIPRIGGIVLTATAS